VTDLRVVFVCTGNICRSPTAEALLRHHAGELPVVADSCGISSEEAGNAPHPLTVAELERRGVAAPSRRARQVRLDDYRSALWLVAMTRAHEKALIRARPRDASAEIRLLASFDPALGGRDVPDPYYGTGRDSFIAVFDMIEQGVLGMLAELRARVG
jgi:protein-tyrosine phosphatase